MHIPSRSSCCNLLFRIYACLADEPDTPYENKTILRRFGKSVSGQSEEQELYVKDAVISEKERTVCRRGEYVELTPKEFCFHDIRDGPDTRESQQKYPDAHFEQYAVKESTPPAHTCTPRQIL